MGAFSRVVDEWRSSPAGFLCTTGSGFRPKGEILQLLGVAFLVIGAGAALCLVADGRTG